MLLILVLIMMRPVSGYGSCQLTIVVCMLQGFAESRRLGAGGDAPQCSFIAGPVSLMLSSTYLLNGACSCSPASPGHTKQLQVAFPMFAIAISTSSPHSNMHRYVMLPTLVAEVLKHGGAHF